MKKKLFGAIFALAVMVATGYGVNKSMSNDADLSEMALSNVEALADGESGGSFNCPGGQKECVRVIHGNEVHIFYEP